MKNPRESLGQLVATRLAALGVSQADFCRNLSLRLRRDPEAYIKYVQLVMAGKRPIPEQATRAWATTLGFYDGSDELAAFVALVSAGRAWGKANGRTYFASLTAENDALRSQVRRLETAVDHLEAEIARLVAVSLPADHATPAGPPR